MYAVVATRPDLCAVVTLLSRFQNKATVELWNSLKRILRYVKGTDSKSGAVEGFCSEDYYFIV